VSCPKKQYQNLH